MRTPQRNSNEYISFCLSYTYRDYLILLIKLTSLVMTAVI